MNQGTTESSEENRSSETNILMSGLALRWAAAEGYLLFLSGFSAVLLVWGSVSSLSNHVFGPTPGAPRSMLETQTLRTCPKWALAVNVFWPGFQLMSVCACAHMYLCKCVSTGVLIHVEARGRPQVLQVLSILSFETPSFTGA